LCWAWQVEFSSVPLLIHAQLFATPWTAARQASLSITNSQSFLKLMSIELVMPSNHLILCCSLLLPSVFPSIRVFYNESVLCIKWLKSFGAPRFTLTPHPIHQQILGPPIFPTRPEPIYFSHRHSPIHTPVITPLAPCRPVCSPRVAGFP